MKRLILYFSLLVLIFFNNAFAQNDESNEDSLRIVTVDTTRIRIMGLIDEINTAVSSIDLLHSENVIKLKTSSLDESGNIEIKVKKPDDLWFRIWGSFAIISKDAFIAHFNRKNFIYFDNLNDKVIEGPSTDANIGYIARIKCSYDDLLNVMSGTCRITYTDRDSLYIDREGNYTVIGVIGTKNAKYWIDSRNTVTKYVYYNKKSKIYLSILFNKLVKINKGYYSRNVEISRPLTKEYIKIFNESYTINNSNLNFKVEFPKDVRRVRW